MKLIIFICLLQLMVSLIEASTDRARCKDVACPATQICPEDSHLKLIAKHHPNHFHHHLNNNVKDSTRKKRALVYGGRQRETIKIIPGAYVHHNSKRSITDDEMLIQHCCPQYECACKPNYCDQECPANKIPANATDPTEQYGVPGNCCVPCKDDYCIHSSKFRKHGDRWLSNDCTDCVCQYGIVSCLALACKTPSCLNYKRIPGECCPICVNDGTTFCAGVGYCSIHCKYGYQRWGDCDLCQCARPPTNGSIHTTVAYPDVESTADNSTENVVDVEDIVRKGPHQNNSYGVIINQFWLYLMCGFALILILGIIVWYCYCRNNAKYDAVQV